MGTENLNGKTQSFLFGGYGRGLGPIGGPVSFEHENSPKQNKEDRKANLSY